MDKASKEQTTAQKTWSTILSGGFAGMVSKTCTAPLERVQILSQTGATHDGILQTLHKLNADGGAKSLWRGNVANCVRVFPHKSILFSCNDFLKHMFPSNSSWASFATGFVFFCQILFFAFLRKAAQSQKQTYRAISQVTKKKEKKYYAKKIKKKKQRVLVRGTSNSGNIPI